MLGRQFVTCFQTFLSLFAHYSLHITWKQSESWNVQNTQLRSSIYFVCRFRVSTRLKDS